MNLTIVRKEFGRVLKRNCNSQWTDSFYYCILKLWHVKITFKRKYFAHDLETTYLDDRHLAYYENI